MLYRHKITGAVIDVESTVRGAWEPVGQTSTDHAADQSADKQTKKAPARKKVREHEVDG